MPTTLKLFRPCSLARPRADVAVPLSPIPTRMVSNGEYMPVPQTDRQKRVEARIEELADEASRDWVDVVFVR